MFGSDKVVWAWYGARRAPYQAHTTISLHLCLLMCYNTSGLLLCRKRKNFVTWLNRYAKSDYEGFFLCRNKQAAARKTLHCAMIFACWETPWGTRYSSTAAPLFLK